MHAHKAEEGVPEDVHDTEDDALRERVERVDELELGVASERDHLCDEVSVEAHAPTAKNAPGTSP